MIEDTAAGVRAGLLDPVELTERALDRAREHAGCNAVTHLDAAGARPAAAAATAGPLAGIPLLVKEIIAVQGLPHTCGSRVFAGRVAGADAEVVRRAREAGAVIIGLTHSHEFAYGCTGTSNVAGPCRNPHDASRMTGGSSAGSAAAVAAGIVPVALGTDTAGSVRIPAALCGVVGAVPQRGTLSSDGVFPLARTLDRVGLLTGSVADARYVTAVLAGIDLTGDALSAPRLGVLADPDLLDCAPEVADAYRTALDRLADAGAFVVEVKPPDWRLFTETAFDLQGPEAAAVHDELDAALDDYQPDLRDRLRDAAAVPGWRYVRARSRMSALTADLGRILATVDAVLLPTVPILAPPLDATEASVSGGRRPVRDLLLRNNRPLNVTPFPALSVPLPGSGGLPVGLQLIATGDRAAFAVAEWVERSL
ncbi:MAG TPA: amidase [Actinophytocola sp.]|uniref:amidase n=1 Tax=Actinophytocola sp. TaxID=1872138 RepID=UPI002DB81FED|nr:amidase [Actinophytocola sp.]HEU5474629.1 amidase [Actinophytocola sp.]